MDEEARGPIETASFSMASQAMAEMEAGVVAFTQTGHWSYRTVLSLETKVDREHQEETTSSVLH